MGRRASGIKGRVSGRIHWQIPTTYIPSVKITTLLHHTVVQVNLQDDSPDPGMTRKIKVSLWMSP
jgi:Gamma-glutamylcysteine synthetase